MKEAGYEGSIKKLRDYTLIKGELYRRLPRGILLRCISEKEGKLRLEELHSQACGVVEESAYTEGCSARGTTGQI